MATDPKKSLASVSISEIAKSDVDQLLQTGLADFSLRELLGLLISSAGAAERGVYLDKKPSDKPNGFYDRSLQLGTIPIEVRVPRTRTGEFRPATLPSHYRRGYSEEVQSLLFELRDGDKLRSACIYLAIGLGRDGKKRVLSCIARPGRENLEDWKTVLRGLMERGE